ncbi:MAG: hypothetical protein AAGB12_05605, partial [Pseudomonadota bacterium]
MLFTLGRPRFKTVIMDAFQKISQLLRNVSANSVDLRANQLGEKSVANVFPVKIIHKPAQNELELVGQSIQHNFKPKQVLANHLSSSNGMLEISKSFKNLATLYLKQPAQFRAYAEIIQSSPALLKALSQSKSIFGKIVAQDASGNLVSTSLGNAYLTTTNNLPLNANVSLRFFNFDNRLQLPILEFIDKAGTTWQPNQLKHLPSHQQGNLSVITTGLSYLTTELGRFLVKTPENIPVNQKGLFLLNTQNPKALHFLTNTHGIVSLLLSSQQIDGQLLPSTALTSPLILQRNYQEKAFFELLRGLLPLQRPLQNVMAQLRANMKTLGALPPSFGFANLLKPTSELILLQSISSTATLHQNANTIKDLLSQVITSYEPRSEVLSSIKTPLNMKGQQETLNLLSLFQSLRSLTLFAIQQIKILSQIPHVPFVSLASGQLSSAALLSFSHMNRVNRARNTQNMISPYFSHFLESSSATDWLQSLESLLNVSEQGIARLKIQKMLNNQFESCQQYHYMDVPVKTEKSSKNTVELEIKEPPKKE